MCATSAVNSMIPPMTMWMKSGISRFGSTFRIFSLSDFLTPQSQKPGPYNASSVGLMN